jgi:hypothetical protein
VARGAGAWALTADELTVVARPTRGAILTGRWSLSFSASDGVVRRGGARWLTDALGARFGEVAGRDVSVTLFAEDLDGDGLPEAIVRRSADASGPSAVRVATWRDGAAVPYPGAASFDGVSELSDVDRDGALDLTWEARVPPGGACDGVPWAPVLTAVAHNTRRGFARDDDTARAWLRAQCPFAPAQLLVRAGEDGDVDVVASFRRAACARVWGASPDAIGRRLQAELPADAPDRCLTAANVTAFARGLWPWLTLPPAPALPPPRPPGASAPPPTVTLAPLPPLVASSALPPPVGPACARVERGHAAWLGRARQESARRGDGAPLDEFVAVLDPSRGCVAAPGGAWALPLDAVRLAPIHTLVASWSVRFVGARGEVWSRREHATPDRSLATIRGVFDYDGDGRGEVILAPTVWGTDTFESDRRWRMYTARGGAVTPYAPAVAAEPFSGVADVDGDGRPDLLDDETFTTSMRCSPESGTIEGPTLLVHARPDGTFSRDDAAARAFVARQCPAPPAWLAAVEGESDFARAWFDVACARLWGASAETVVQSLVVALQRPGSRLTDTCESFRLLAHGAMQRPPLVLTAADLPVTLTPRRAAP